MNWLKLVEGVSNLLSHHSKALILILSLLLVCLLVKGLESSFMLSEVYVWMYFFAVIVSFLVVAMVLYLLSNIEK